MSDAAALHPPAVSAAVGLVTGLLALTVARLVRGITFYGANTDNAKQARTAAAFGRLWRWPSRMHRVVDDGVRTRMKDVTVLALTLAQRLAGDRVTDYPLVALCVVANAVSALLAFAVASAYWQAGIGLLIWGLFVTCLWPSYLALFGAHICVGQMFALLSVWCLQHAPRVDAGSGLIWYGAAGAAAGLTLFASPSARKYMPLLLAALWWSLRGSLGLPGHAGASASELSGTLQLAVGAGAASLWLAGALAPGGLSSVVRMAHRGRAPWGMRRLLAGRDRVELETYLAHARRAGEVVRIACRFGALYLAGSLVVARSGAFYGAHGAVLCGLGLVVLTLTVPDVPGSLWAYYHHSQGWRFNRFGEYRAHFARAGRPIAEGMRGGGWTWIPRFLWRVAPVHSILAVGSAALLAGLGLSGGVAGAVESIVILGVACSPFVAGELSRSPQTGRAYLPGLLGLLWGIGAAAFRMAQLPGTAGAAVLWIVGGSVVLWSGWWTRRMFLADVWPARMAPAWMARTLEALRASEVWTYDTPYNDAFVDALPAATRERVAVRHLRRLADAAQGYIAVPGTSAKAFNMESQRWAIDHGDFRLDPELNELLASRAIRQQAVRAFKTFGTSRIWVHESEVMSYRDLILGEITEADRWRGTAWVLDAARLRARRTMAG
jgi:hypothetical protein